MKQLVSHLVVSSAEWMSFRLPAVHGMRVHWYDHWDADLEDALQALPELDGLSHDDLRLLATNDGPAEKQHTIVSSRGHVCGVVSMRKREGYWEPVTALCLPTVVVPTAGDSLHDVLRATSVEFHIPEFFGPRSEFPDAATTPFEVYGVDLQSEYDRHWRDNGYWKTIRSIRNRTAHLEVRVDEPGDIDWVIDQWVTNWNDDPLQMALAAPDMRLLWKRFREDGRIQTIAVAEGDEILAGAVNLIENGSIIGLCTARVGDRPSYSLGTKLIDTSFEVCQSLGYKHFDLGGWGDYKHRLAPVSGERYLITLQPPLVRAVSKSRDIAAHVKRRFIERRSRPRTGDETPPAPESRN